jgi:hypothetical protein
MSHKSWVFIVPAVSQHYTMGSINFYSSKLSASRHSSFYDLLRPVYEKPCPLSISLPFLFPFVEGFGILQRCTAIEHMITREWLGRVLEKRDCGLIEAKSINISGIDENHQSRTQLGLRTTVSEGMYVIVTWNKIINNLGISANTLRVGRPETRISKSGMGKIFVFLVIVALVCIQVPMQLIPGWGGGNNRSIKLTARLLLIPTVCRFGQSVPVSMSSQSNA